MSLKALVTQHNNMDAMFFGGKNQWSVHPTPEMAQDMFSRLDSNLSPEVVYQDGERRGAKAEKFKKEQLAAIAELKAKGFQPAREMFNV